MREIAGGPVHRTILCTAQVSECLTESLRLKAVFVDQRNSRDVVVPHRDVLLELDCCKRSSLRGRVFTNVADLH